MRHVSEKTKLRERRGTGTGPDYIPWIRISEFNSNGVACAFVDWKHGRAVQLLSRAEKAVYLKLRWNDAVTDIREQFPLDLDETNGIADELNIRRPQNGRFRMTTDFLISYEDGSTKALSVKTSQKEITDNARNRELALIEYIYWKRHGIEWRFIGADTLNPYEIRNIENVVTFWDIRNVATEIDLIKHLIARKTIITDMNINLNYIALIERAKKDSVWELHSHHILDSGMK